MKEMKNSHSIVIRWSLSSHSVVTQWSFNGKSIKGLNYEIRRIAGL